MSGNKKRDDKIPIFDDAHDAVPSHKPPKTPPPPPPSKTKD